MSNLDDLITRAAMSPALIALSEGEDPRVVDAAIRASNEGIAKIILIGDHTKISKLLGVNIDDPNIRIEDPKHSDHISTLTDTYMKLRHKDAMSQNTAKQQVMHPQIYAALLVHKDMADGTLGGAVITSSKIISAALRIIGPKKDGQHVSSFFLMYFPDTHPMASRTFLYSDCGLTIDPDANELAQIAIASASSYETLVGKPSRIAMLSFSTLGSARHPNLQKVTEATQWVQKHHPDINIDGELQFDAALLPEIAAQKAPNSKVAGIANTFIFPDLNSGNIAYKITERLASARALGPIIQGLAKPANDLSRGCSANDIFYMIAITSIQSQSEAINEQ